MVGAEEEAAEGDQPNVLLESSEGLAKLRTQPGFATNLNIQEESLRLSLASGVSLHLGSVAVEERLMQVSALDDSEMPEAGEENQGRLEVTYAPEEEARWESTSLAFWLDVAGLIGEETAAQAGGTIPMRPPGVAALEQMLGMGARFSFPVDTYDLATYCQDTRIFLAEMSPETQGIAKKAFDCWRDLLEFGASLARQCQCQRNCYNCLLHTAPYGRDLDKVEGLALVDRLLEVTQEA